MDAQYKSAIGTRPLLTSATLVIILLCHLHSAQDNNSPPAQFPKCYDSPEELFQIVPLSNGSFRLNIIDQKCAELPYLEMNLYAFDLSIVDQVDQKIEVDTLDKSKLDKIKINRKTLKFGRRELSHFDQHSKFKFAIVFTDQSGVEEVAMMKRVFSLLPEQPQSTTTEIVLIAFLGVLLFIMCVLLSILIYINYFGSGQLQSYLIFWRKEDNRKLIKDDEVENGNANTFEPKSNIIPVNELLSRVPTMLETDATKNEYNYVPRSQMFSWNQAKLPENRTKNRYGNLLPYDHTRVILKKESPNETDYMNANFIDGYKKSGRYIAMQGPIDATLEDFWRCVWQFKCTQIVILTNLEESGKSKCDKYWPDISHFYGKVKVTLQKTELFADYTIRHFMLEKDGESVVVVQYHFLSWPDHMVPMYACSLISFVNCIRSSPLYQESSPMVVHCSAGIGRTGAFIVIDSMLRMAEKEKKIDVFGHFCKIRLQRINMVEKYAQYRFVYQVLLEALSHDPTDIGCTDFAAYLSKMTTVHDNNCLLHKQYEIVNTMSFNKLSPGVCKFGAINFQFNRRQDVIPPDYARVILPNVNDYINAVYVNGYRKQDAYIVTQVPFENNRQQFWQMVACTEASLIVLLGDLSEDQVYWPTTMNQTMATEHELTITLQKEEVSTTMTTRTFVLRPVELTVKLVHVRTFPNPLTKPVSNQLLIELKEKIDALSIGCNSAPLIIQCLDGVALCGLFCAADFIFERIKEEQQIDVFLAVQKIRANRPQFITSYEQYLYLYQVALAYLKSFDQYANFK